MAIGAQKQTLGETLGKIAWEGGLRGLYLLPFIVLTLWFPEDSPTNLITEKM